MEVELITGMITSVGFPIAVCVFLLYERNKMMQKLFEIVHANTEATKELKIMIESKM